MNFPPFFFTSLKIVVCKLFQTGASKICVKCWLVDYMVFNPVFNSISVISQRSVHLSMISCNSFKGGHLDFSHLTELEMYISLKFILKNNINHQELRIIRLLKKMFLMRVPFKGYVAS